MREQELRQLIRMVEDSDIESLEIRRFFRTIRITKRSSANGNGSANHSHAHLVEVPVQQSMPAPPVTPVAPVASPTPVPEPAQPSNLIEIKAPMVGTFYRAAAPGSAPFVDVGKTISTGDVLCIIEAMKLMNEIEAEQGGRIAKIMLENGSPIEYGQVLFLLEPA